MHRLLFVLLVSACSAAGAVSQYTFSNTPGPHPIGLQVKQQYDYARQFKPKLDPETAQAVSGERARPIQALIWYPAQGKGKPLVYRDYVDTAATEINFSLSADAVRKASKALLANRVIGPRGEQVKQDIARTMWATRDAPARAGKFPVVIYSPSRSAPAMDNADMCEYLASHGYIVIASPSMGSYARDMSTDLEGLETQADDIRYLIGLSHSLPNADTARLAVVGFSWGGLANVLAAARDDRIGALVSLDGSVRGHTEYVDGGKDAAKYVTPARVAVPLLYVARKRPSLEEINTMEINTTFNFLNRMKYSDVYVVTMHPMKHMNFSSWALRIESEGNFDEYTRDEASVAYTWTARYVHQFLDAYIKKDTAAKAFMSNSPVANKVPAHMLSMDARPAKEAPPTRATFISMLTRDGFAQAIPAYESLHAKDASVVYGASELNDWGYRLLASGRAKDGIEIFKLATHLFPTDGNLFDSLAEGYEADGQTAMAIKHYQRALDLDPKNKHAVDRLKVLAK